ncbi:MAG: hypothetical protein IH859_01245 [Chloroflexi bacterium]|nr:hypothetical protein [Chloroflexota bacterium]
MKSKRLFISIVSLFSLAFAACSMHITTEIEADGSGVFRVKFSLTEEDIAVIEKESGDTIENMLQDEYGDTSMENACEELAKDNDFPTHATGEFSDSGAEFSCEISLTFDDLDELIEFYEELFGGMTGKVRMNDAGDLSYAIDLDMNNFDSGEDAGFEEFESLWIVKAPGTIENHNADDKRGGTLTWELDDEDFESIEFESVPGVLFGADASLFWILAFVFLCLCAVVLVVAGGVGFYVYSQNKRNDEE